jgi:SAM-dependent methyltransferase
MKRASNVKEVPAKGAKGKKRSGGAKGAGKGGKAKGKKKKAKKERRYRYTAETADKYELYQLAVQSADVDVEFLRDTYKELRGKDARILREDFCGTALLCTEWVKLHPDNTAVGYDLDPEPLEWGREHNIAPLGDAAKRIEIHQQDAREPGKVKPDVRVAQNFSYWLFRQRDELKDYFKRVLKSLAPGGIFVIDLYGGTEATEEMTEERKIEGGFTYVWDQDLYYPGTGEFTCYIHFEFRDGSRMDKAFSYTWRVWGMPELKDLLHEVGFTQVDSYFEGSDDEEEGEGNGVFEKDDRGENCESWIAYLVAQP